jgi:hypothetical protein
MLQATEKYIAQITGSYNAGRRSLNTVPFHSKIIRLKHSFPITHVLIWRGLGERMIIGLETGFSITHFQVYMKFLNMSKIITEIPFKTIIINIGSSVCLNIKGT